MMYTIGMVIVVVNKDFMKMVRNVKNVYILVWIVEMILPVMNVPMDII